MCDDKPIPVPTLYLSFWQATVPIGNLLFALYLYVVVSFMNVVNTICCKILINSFTVRLPYL